VHEGWPCSRGSLLTDTGRRWVGALRLNPTARAQIDTMLTVMATLAQEIDLIDCGLRRLAKSDPRLRAMQQIYGIGPILACTILAEIGDATRFRRARQVVRADGLDPAARESADKRRRGHLAKQGAPNLRWSRPPNTPPAEPAPTTTSIAATTVTPTPSRHALHRSQDRQARLPRTAGAQRRDRLTHSRSVPRGNARRTG